MKKIRFSLKVIYIYMKNQMQTKSYVLYDFINMFARCFIVFLLYGYVYKINNNSINGTDLYSSLWSMFFYFCIMTLALRRISNIIMADVRSGNVEMFLNKQVNYVYLNCLKVIGNNIFSFLTITIIGIIVMILTIGLPKVNILLFIPSLLITFVLGQVLAILMYSIIGLLSFFMQDIRPIYWIADKMVMILGGSYLPVALFPKILKILTYVSPFGAVNFATSTVYSSWNTSWYLVIGIQVFWIIIFSFLMKFVYQKAKEKAMVNGG